ncbi:MAG: monovalent cation/H+ antiporter subunit D family protein [Deltaproteobacteria bacterium]|nr:MAG: monovalent cation/H+ antiporter subunit D family protein [Deltaproteobacteria bacterium]
MIQQLPAIIVVFPLVMSFFVVVTGLWSKRICFPLVVTAISVCVLSAGIILSSVINQGPIHYWLGGWQPPWGIEYFVDHLNAFMLVAVSLLSLLVAVHSKRSVEQELPEKRSQFWSLFLLLITGLLGITITGDMFNLFVLLEVASLSGYALIAMGQKKAVFASFRYLVMGTIGASWYLLGVGYLYIITGSLNIANLSELLPHMYQSKTVLVGFAFILVGIGIKMALFPLHAWLPDAYTYAPSAVSTTVAPLMTKVMAYVLIRVIFSVFKPYFSIEEIPATTILAWMAAVAIVVGSIYAIAQTNLKKMLSYSVVAQIGYIALGIGLANRFGLTGAVLHIFNEIITKGCVFAVAGAVVYKKSACNTRELENLYRKMPFTMLAFTVGAFSMIGIPPTLGFFSKLYLILGSIDAKQWVFVGILLFSSILNGVYFFRIIQIASFETPMPDYSRGTPYEKVPMDEAPLSMIIPMQIMAAGILIAGIFSADIVSTVIQYVIPEGF